MDDPIWNNSGPGLEVQIEGTPSVGRGTFTTSGPVDLPDTGRINVWIDLNERPRWWQFWAWPRWLWQRARGGRFETYHYTKIDGLTFTLEDRDE